MVDPAPKDGSAGFDELDRRFERAVADLLAGSRSASVLYSGGVDSTLVARALPADVDLELVNVSTSASRDRGAAQFGARWLGRPLRTVEPDPDRIRAVLRGPEFRGGEPRGPARAVQVALAIGLEACSNRLVWTGQGADELFGGYAHFRGLSAAQGRERRRRDLDRLLGQDWPFSRRIAAGRGRELVSPFLDGPFRELALARELESPGEGEPTKRPLRRWALHRGIPREIADRPKVALQFGSGVDRALRRIDRSGGDAPGSTAI